MRIVISGATGLVGAALRSALLTENNDVARLVRPGSSQLAGDIRWDPASGAIDAAAMEGTDAVVNLNGAGIGDSRWTAERKKVLRSSRVDSTRVLVDALAKLQRRPRVFISSSAIGYYGSRGDEVLTEASASGGDFIAALSRDWEAEALRADAVGVRAVIVRFGIVLSVKGGALARMLTPFKLGAGGRLGSGTQWMSWIALDDVVGAIRAAIVNDKLRGPVNAVAPNPVQNSEFTRSLAKVLHRPAIFPAPAFALRLALGEMADALLLSSQRVQPERLISAGFKFRFENLESALRAALGRK
jgi:uncharacterized protein (TIGR01777 family)